MVRFAWQFTVFQSLAIEYSGDIRPLATINSLSYGDQCVLEGCPVPLVHTRLQTNVLSAAFNISSALQTICDVYPVFDVLDVLTLAKFNEFTNLTLRPGPVYLLLNGVLFRCTMGCFLRNRLSYELNTSLGKLHRVSTKKLL